MKNRESQLQIHCVRWFRLQYPEYSKLLFSIPNGGKRNAVTASILKAEGALAGVSDLELALPCADNHGLYIEMKADKKGRMSEKQKEFRAAIESVGYSYELVYTFERFQTVCEAQVLKHMSYHGEIKRK